MLTLCYATPPPPLPKNPSQLASTYLVLAQNLGVFGRPSGADLQQEAVGVEPEQGRRGHRAPHRANLAVVRLLLSSVNQF